MATKTRKAPQAEPTITLTIDQLVHICSTQNRIEYETAINIHTGEASDRAIEAADMALRAAGFTDQQATDFSESVSQAADAWRAEADSTSTH